MKKEKLLEAYEKINNLGFKKIKDTDEDVIGHLERQHNVNFPNHKDTIVFYKEGRFRMSYITSNFNELEAIVDYGRALYQNEDSKNDVEEIEGKLKKQKSTIMVKRPLMQKCFTLRDMTLKEYREFINFGYAFAPMLEDLVNFYFTKNHSDDIQNAEWGILKSIMKDEILDREYVLALYEKDKE